MPRLPRRYRMGAFVNLFLRSPEELSLLATFSPEELATLTRGEIRLLVALAHEELPDLPLTSTLHATQQAYAGRMIERSTAIEYEATESRVNRKAETPPSRAVNAEEDTHQHYRQAGPVHTG